MIDCDVQVIKKLDEGRAADRLGLKPHTMRNWRHLGRGPRYYKVGRRVFYDVADLDKFLEKCLVDPQSN